MNEELNNKKKQFSIFLLFIYKENELININYKNLFLKYLNLENNIIDENYIEILFFNEIFYLYLNNDFINELKLNLDNKKKKIINNFLKNIIIIKYNFLNENNSYFLKELKEFFNLNYEDIEKIDDLYIIIFIYFYVSFIFKNKSKFDFIFNLQQLISFLSINIEYIISDISFLLIYQNNIYNKVEISHEYLNIYLNNCILSLNLYSNKKNIIKIINNYEKIINNNNKNININYYLNNKYLKNKNKIISFFIENFIIILNNDKDKNFIFKSIDLYYSKDKNIQKYQYFFILKDSKYINMFKYINNLNYLDLLNENSLKKIYFINNIFLNTNYIKNNKYNTNIILKNKNVIKNIDNYISNTKIDLNSYYFECYKKIFNDILSKNINLNIYTININDLDEIILNNVINKINDILELNFNNFDFFNNFENLLNNLINIYYNIYNYINIYFLIDLEKNLLFNKNFYEKYINLLNFLLFNKNILLDINSKKFNINEIIIFCNKFKLNLIFIDNIIYEYLNLIKNNNNLNININYILNSIKILKKIELLNINFLKLKIFFEKISININFIKIKEYLQFGFFLDFRYRFYTNFPSLDWINNKFLRNIYKNYEICEWNKIQEDYIKILYNYKNINIKTNYCISLRFLDLSIDYLIKINEKFINYKYLIDYKNLNIKDLIEKLKNLEDFKKILFLENIFSSIYIVSKYLFKNKKNYIDIIFNFFDNYNIDNYFLLSKKLNIESCFECEIHLYNLSSYLDKNNELNLNLCPNLILDSSCNGFTHLLFLFKNLDIEKFKIFFEKLNLSSSLELNDFYNYICFILIDKIKSNKKYINLLKIDLNDLINRTNMKKIIMTIPYGSTSFKWRNILKNVFLNKKTFNYKLLLNIIIEEISKIFTNDNSLIPNSYLTILKNWLKNNKEGNIIFNRKDNTLINLNYYKIKRSKFIFKLKINKFKKEAHMNTIDNKIDINKTIQSLIPNIVHSQDSYIFYLIINNYKLFLLTIHDSFITNNYNYSLIILSYKYNFYDCYYNYNIYNNIILKNKNNEIITFKDLLLSLNKYNDSDNKEYNKILKDTLNSIFILK